MRSRESLWLRAGLVSLSLLAPGCGGTTGSGLASFTARVGGPAGIAGGQPLTFTTGSGYQVTLTSAALHLGAVYLNKSRPASGGAEESCVLPGIYVAQAFGACPQTSGACGIDVDLLSPELVPFPLPGQGTADTALEAEVWLTGGDINAPDDPTPILQASGTAQSGGQAWPFSASVTIGQNRAVPAANLAMPGANPICHQRIASNIPVDFLIADGGTLDLRIDPRGMWHGVEFSSLSQGGAAPPYTIPDDNDEVSTGKALFKGILANSGVYQFSFTGPAH